jgi:hypothetical protein
MLKIVLGSGQKICKVTKYCNLDTDFFYGLERVRNEFFAVLALKSLRKFGAGNGARTRGKDAGIVTGVLLAVF